MDDLQILLVKLKILAKVEEDPSKRMVFEEAAATLERLFEENESLWDMLDEMKASDMALHNEPLENALTTLSSLLSSKGGGDA